MMITITQLLEDLTYLNGTLHSVTTTPDGVMTLTMDFDEIDRVSNEVLAG